MEEMSVRRSRTEGASAAQQDAPETRGQANGAARGAEMRIVYLSPHELTPYEHNTRKHAPDDIGQIKASIEADGFNDPIGIWGDDNLIVEGHGRQIAAIEMGLERVPCIRLDHLSDAQRRDYAIRHNFTSDQSEFDFGRLREEVAALELQGLDMSYLDGIGEELEKLDERPEMQLHDKYQLIIDCADEDDMQQKYEVLQEAGIECRVSTL